MRRTCTGSRILLPAKCPTAYWCPTLGITLQRNGISLLLPSQKIVPKGVYMGDHVYFNKHSSAAKGILWHAKLQFMDTGAPQARHNNRASAGPGTMQVTATQWLIFKKVYKLYVEATDNYST